MKYYPAITMFILISLTAHHAVACTSEKTCKQPVQSSDKVENTDTSLNQIFEKINDVAKDLQTCQADIAFTTIQDPELLDTRILRNGTLYYAKNLNQRDQLRIHFKDVKQDDFEPEQEREEYLFDGVWLTRINFKLKQVDIYQKAPEDKPVAVFKLIENNFPIVGFSGSEGLQRDFEIVRTNQDPNEPICLILTPKKDTKFSKEYKKVEFQINSDSYLPAKIISYSTQGDIYKIVFNGIKVNKKLENAVFTVETPDSFRKNIEYINDSKKQKGS